MTPSTIRAGVMGWPVAHSRSPLIHGYWLRQYRIDGRYEALAVPPDDFERVFRALPAEGFAGVNITLPHKEAAFRACDEIDGLACRLGAVNTVVVGKDNRLRGTNTDGYGFMENLRAGAPGWRPDAGPAVVLGAGGAARAVVAALIDAGVPRLRLLNRTAARAALLAKELGGPVEVCDWSTRGEALDGAALLVNTTTLGMAGAPPLELDLGALPIEAVVTDIVYTPLMTPLLRNATRHGNKVVDGLGMLLHQARPGFRAWFGVEPVVSPELRSLVIADIEGKTS